MHSYQCEVSDVIRKLLGEFEDINIFTYVHLWIISSTEFEEIILSALVTLWSLWYDKKIMRKLKRKWNLYQETFQVSMTVVVKKFWDQVWWFLSLRVFGLLSSSLLLFPQRFGWDFLRPSSSVCWTREPTRNFELRPLLNPQGSPVLIPLAITGYNF